MDIAPLGFSVDTGPLAAAGKAADDATDKLNRVADAADKVGESSKKAAPHSYEHKKAMTEQQIAAKNLHNELLLTHQQMLGFVSAHDQLAERSKKVSQTSQQVEKDLRLVATTLDPTTAKILKMGEALAANERAFKSGGQGLEQYRRQAAALWSELERLQKSPPGGAQPHGRQHIGPGGELLREFTYGFPGFGRAGRSIMSAVTGGVGLGGVARLAAGAAGGIIAVEAVRQLTELPEKFSKAEDEAEKLQRRLESFGAGSGALEEVEKTASKLALSVKGAAAALIDFRNEFTRLNQDAETQDKAFAAVVAAGRLGGLTEDQQLSSARQFAALGNKALVSGADILALQSSNPNLANNLGAGLGVGDSNGLLRLAATGQVTGQQLLDTAAKLNSGLQVQNAKLRKSGEELNVQIDDTFQKGFAAIGGSAIRWFREKVELPVVGWFANVAGAGEASAPGLGRSAAISLPSPGAAARAQLAKTLGATESYDSYEIGQAKLRSDKALIEAQISAGASGKDLEALNRRLREVNSALTDTVTPFQRITDQINDMTDAIGRGGGNNTLTGVWSQALEIQREQIRLGHGLTGSLQDIVDSLIKLKQAQQALGDTKEIEELNKQLAKTAAITAAIGGGSYAERLAAFQSDISSFRTERSALGGVTGAPAGPVSAAQFIDVIRQIESRGRDFGPDGKPLTSSAGALYSMQVMPGTARSPGYGIAPARNQSAAEYNRVGEELAAKLLSIYGDPLTAGAAYHSGPGNLSRLSPAGRDYQRQIAARLGGSTVGAGVDLTGNVVTGRTNVFNANEAQQATRMLDSINNANNDNVRRIEAIMTSPEAARNLELQLKVEKAREAVAPEYRDAIEADIRNADVTERRLKAEERIADLKQASNDNDRRNAAARTGDAGLMRQLELQLRIEEIRRSGAPPEQKDRLAKAAINEDRQQQQRIVDEREGNLRNQQRALREQLKIIQFTGDEEIIQNRLLDERNKLYAAGVDLNGDLALKYLEEVEILERQNLALEKQLERWQLIKDTGRQVADDIGRAWLDAFGRATRTGKVQWKDFIGDIEQAFYTAVDNMVQKLVISPLIDILSGALTKGLGSLFGTSGPNLLTNNGSTAPITYTAMGAALPGPITPFGLGDILNTPTRFRYGRGTGLGGEAGYEGIMPLKRGPDGKLGVVAMGGVNGGGTSVQIIDQRAAGTSEAVQVQERTSGDGQRQISLLIRDSVKSHMQSGAFDADQRAVYGVPRAVARR